MNADEFRGRHPEIDARLDYLQHFLELAKQGRRKGASGGEKRAAKLCRAVLDNVPGLDASGVAGLLEFVRTAARQPDTARQIAETGI